MLNVEVVDDIVRWSDEYGVDPDLAAAILYAESYGFPDVIGSSGERGYMQIIPGTAEYIAAITGMSYDSIIGDNSTNIRAGVWYISIWLTRFGDMEMALAAYNGGPGHVIECNCVPDMTRHYVDKVMRLYNEHIITGISQEAVSAIVCSNRNRDRCISENNRW